MPISEPSSLLTDYLLAAVALSLSVRLFAVTRAGGSLARRFWAAAFAAGALAAIAGGTVHGFTDSLPPYVRATLWTGWLMAAAISGALVLAGMACETFRGGARNLALGVVAILLIVQLGLVYREPVAVHAVTGAAVSFVLLLALVAWRARSDAGLVGPIGLGLAIACAGLAAQRAGLSLHAHFNHNDLAHVLLTASLFPFYRAGLRLRPSAE